MIKPICADSALNPNLLTNLVLGQVLKASYDWVLNPSLYVILTIIVTICCITVLHRFRYFIVFSLLNFVVFRKVGRVRRAAKK